MLEEALVFQRHAVGEYQYADLSSRKRAVAARPIVGAPDNRSV